MADPNRSTVTPDDTISSEAPAPPNGHEPKHLIVRPVLRTTRPVSLWDVSGVLLVVFAMLLVTQILPNYYEALDRPEWLQGAVLLVGLATATTLAISGARERPALSTIARRLTQVWHDPPGDWPAFLLGWALSLPLVDLFNPTLFADADSMRLIAAIKHVQRGHLDFLVETHDSFGPHIFLGPAALLGGASGMRWFTIISLQLLGAVVAWVSRRASGSMAAAAVAPLALFCIEPLVQRAHYLPMYPTTLAFGTLGTWLAFRVIGQGARWGHALAAGLCLSLTVEAHGIGQLVLGVPLILLVTASRLRPGLGGLARVYGATALFMLPRLFVNLREGGLSHLRSNRVDFWTTKGYLVDVQTEFWDYSGLGESRLTYLDKYTGRLVEGLGEHGWLVALLAGIGLVVAVRGRYRWFALGFLSLIVAAMTVRTIQPAARYFSPLWPGMTVLSALVGAWLLTRAIRRRWVAIPARALGAVVVGALAVGSVLTLDAIAEASQEIVERREEDDYDEVAEAIDDDKALLGSRPHILLSADVNIPTYGGQFLTEDEYATYLTWPSDEAVIRLMRRHDIGWVVIKGGTGLETNYHNTWLIPNHGRGARHVKMIANSPNFCVAALEEPVILYRLDIPESRDEGSANSGDDSERAGRECRES